MYRCISTCMYKCLNEWMQDKYNCVNVSMCKYENI